MKFYTVKIGAFKEDKQNMLSNVATTSNEAGARSGVRNVPLKDNTKLTDRQVVILSILRDNVPLNVPLNTTALSQKLKVARKTTQRELGELQKIGAVSRLGGRKFGYWIINENWNKR
jgi:predicted HTH transcriptional regulator